MKYPQMCGLFMVCRSAPLLVTMIVLRSLAEKKFLRPKNQNLSAENPNLSAKVKRKISRMVMKRVR